MRTYYQIATRTETGGLGHYQVHQNFSSFRSNIKITTPNVVMMLYLCLAKTIQG